MRKHPISVCSIAYRHMQIAFLESLGEFFGQLEVYTVEDHVGLCCTRIYKFTVGVLRVTRQKQGMEAVLTVFSKIVSETLSKLSIRVMISIVLV